MRRLVATLASVILIAQVAACAAKATSEDCAKACANVTSVFLGSVDSQTKSDDVLKSMGEKGASMAREMANLTLEFLRDECQKTCTEKATVKQTQCLVAAKTTTDLARCNQ